jgi:hypothetical protein
MDGFAGFTAVTANNATAGFTNLTAAQAAAVTLATNVTSTTLSLKTATGTSDVLGVTLKNTTATTSADFASATITGFETLNVTSSSGVKVATGDINVISFAAAADLTTITVGGEYSAALDLTNTAKAVTVTSTQTGTAILNVQGAAIKGSSITTTANIDTITTAAVAGTTGDFVTYNAGAGNDVVKTTAGFLNNISAASGSLKLEGGAGTDTLELTAAGAMTDAHFQFVTGFEKITNSGTNQAVDISTGGFFNTNFAGAVEFATNSGTANTAINLQSYTGAATVATTVAANGATSVTTGSGADKVTVTSAGAGTVAVDTGLGNDTVDMTNSAATGGTTILTGAGNDIITGVVVAATITAGTGADAITVGAGAQTIVIGNTDSGITVATADSVTGFLSGTDFLKMGTAADAATANAVNYSEASIAVADFAAALTAANTALATLAAGNTGAVEAYNIQWDATNGYVFNDTNGDGTADQVVLLVGVTGASIAATDIIA